MSDQWKTVRIRSELHARVEQRAKVADRSVASQLEHLTEVGLAHVENRVPPILSSLRDALAEAEEKGAGRAVLILRQAIGEEEKS